MQSSSFDKIGTALAVRILQVSKQLRQHRSVGYAMAFVSVAAASFIQWLGQDPYAGRHF
jgi:hypothetical protein